MSTKDKELNILVLMFYTIQVPPWLWPQNCKHIFLLCILLISPKKFMLISPFYEVFVNFCYLQHRLVATSCYNDCNLITISYITTNQTCKMSFLW